MPSAEAPPRVIKGGFSDMAKNMQPVAKRCKALGISPAVMGYTKKTTNRNPGGQMRRKKSDYGIQLNEKQKVKFIYGILEKQFRSYYESAAAAPGRTGDNLLITVERRLDNVVYRMGFAMTRRQARQLVTHAHFTVNGKKVNIPSYLVKAGDVIEVEEASRSSVIFKRLTGQDAPIFLLPAWMEREKNALKGTITRLPAREDIDVPVEEHLIVELYSK
jgi:small subunit ribosomal protein S4